MLCIHWLVQLMHCLYKALFMSNKTVYSFAYNTAILVVIIFVLSYAARTLRMVVGVTLGHHKASCPRVMVTTADLMPSSNISKGKTDALMIPFIMTLIWKPTGGEP